MKNRILLIVVAIACCLSSQAQISRLIGLTKTKYNGLNFSTIGDTINYMYTGGMDTTRRGALAYDSAYSMVSGTGYTPGNLSYRTYQTFSDTFNLASVMAQSFDTPSAAWVNYQYVNNTYDAGNNLTQAILQVRDVATGGWINSTNNTYTFTGGNEITRILQGWNTTLSTPAWANREKDTFAYDGSNNMIYHLAQTWDTTALSWRNTNLYLVTYNTLNQVTTIDHQVWNVPGSVWKNNTYTTYEYNAANLLSNTIVQRWDTGLLVWNNATADTIDYDGAGNKLVETNLRWDTAAHTWANQIRNKFTYDGSHNMITDTTLNWNTGAGAFVYNKLRINSYNSYNQVLVTTTESWNNPTSSWIYRLGGGPGPGGAADIEWRYYYEIYPPITTSVGGAATASGHLSVYPVPASGHITVKLDWKNAAPFTVTILDITGRIVRQWNEPATQTYSRMLPVNDLAPGSYIIKARSHTSQAMQQFVIE